MLGLQVWATMPLLLLVLFVGEPGVQDRVSQCSPGCNGTHSVEQGGFELRDPERWD